MTIIDFETRSQVDVRDVGPYEYANHPSTRILCLGVKLPDREKYCIIESRLTDKKSKEIGLIQDHFRENVWAHNSMFEFCMWNYCLIKKYPNHWPDLHFDRNLNCSAALAASLGLPRKLDHVGASTCLDLKNKKDSEGHSVMLRLSRTRNGRDDFFEIKDRPELFERMYEYNLRDLDAEEEVLQKLSKYKLTPKEHEVWRFDQKINLRGFRVDLPAIKSAYRLFKNETDRLKAAVFEITNGDIFSGTQVEQLRDFLNERYDLDIPDLRAQTVSEFLKKDDLDPNAKILLRARQAASKTSTSKYQAFLNRVNAQDHRIRDSMMYHGASTGRVAGMGVQPHNFPKGKIRNMNMAVSLLRTEDPELIELVYGMDLLDFLSSCLRGMILPDVGEELGAADFSQIEARILFWLFNEKAGLRAFEGADPYIGLASDIYKKPIEEISTEERFLGKQATLGCGFGMGIDKFVITCAGYGVKIKRELAELAVKTYREKYSGVVKGWKALEEAMAYTIKHRKTTKIFRVKFSIDDMFLFCTLPSGRKLAYFKPSLKLTEMPWGEKKMAIHYWGIDPTTHQYRLEKTYGGKITENIVQAIARDCMVEAMLRVEKNNFKVLLSIHDEVLASQKNFDLDKYLKLIAQRPEWGQEIPIKCEGFKDERYRK